MHLSNADLVKTNEPLLEYNLETNLAICPTSYNILINIKLKIITLPINAQYPTSQSLTISNQSFAFRPFNQFPR